MAVPFFTVVRRNFGHWDFCNDNGRMFRLRGGPGRWRVSDERTLPCPPWLTFRDQGAAIAWITAELMWEPLTVDGQTAHVMEAWNTND